MLMRSTGLGKTELVAHIRDVRPQGDHLIMYMDTSDPVRWKVRGTITFREVVRLLLTCLKLSVVLFLLKFLLNPFRWFRAPQHPGDY